MAAILHGQRADPQQTPLTRLLVSCPDRPGIVAAVSRFLSDRGANIVSSQQHSTDPEGGTFFMRTEFTLALGQREREEFERRFGEEVAAAFSMEWRCWDTRQPKRMALLVSGEDHCLLDQLWRWRRGDLGAEILMVVSNHPDLRKDAEAFDVPYHHVPVERDDKQPAEARMLELLAGRVELIVLARYMQTLSREFLDRVGVPVINIHHSFLPAFAGSAPYAQAKQRGVKLIGATAHYVTEQLDAGPIIEQDVIRVSHRDSVASLARLGADIERTVLARAVRWHCEDRVIVHDNATVVL
jgi:formyltetrahydrofolate deformylase